MTNKKFLNQIILVFFVFLLSQIILGIILHYLKGEYFNSNNWSRWDSNLYLQIVTGGYDLFPCAGKFGYPLDSKEICGNAGWFPGYPLIIKLFTYIFKNPEIIGGIISKLFYVLSLLMVVKIMDISRFTLKNILFVCIAAFSFGSIYYNAIFPISAVIFFALSGLYFYIKRKIWLTGLFCFLASFFYPTGFLLSIVFGILILIRLIRKNENFKQKAITFLIPTIMGALGVISVFIIFQITVNDWTAFLQIQSKYGHRFMNPVKNIISFFHEKSILKPYELKNFIQYQSFLVIITYVLISIFFVIKRLYKNELFLWSYIYVTLFFIFPWVVGNGLSMYRAESLLLPFVFLLKDLKTPWLAIILIFLLCIGIPMSILFFNETLV